MDRVLEVINMINEVHDSEFVELTGDIAIYIFQNGYCFYFAQLLKMFFPNGELYMNKSGGHIALKIGNFLFDNLGFLYDSNETYHPFEDADWYIVETMMIPSDFAERQKMENNINEIYDRVKMKYFDNSETILRKKLELN